MQLFALFQQCRFFCKKMHIHQNHIKKKNKPKYVSLAWTSPLISKFSFLSYPIFYNSLNYQTSYSLYHYRASESFFENLNNHMSWHRTGNLPPGALNPFPAVASNHTNNPIHKYAEFPLRTMKFVCYTVFASRLEPKLSVPQLWRKIKFLLYLINASFWKIS